MEEKLVSIITPMWKGASLLGKTIDSVVSQSYKNWEMIIVDDASPDDGAGCKVVQSHAEKDSRFILSVQKRIGVLQVRVKQLVEKRMVSQKFSAYFIYIIEEF